LEAQRTVDIIRRIRHDFGNHLQVISGYIELEKYKEVKRYINSITEEMGAERSIFETGNADTALYLYKQMLMARDLGIILRYKDLHISKPDMLLDKNEPYNSLVKLTGKVEIKDDEPVVYISLYEENNEVKMLFGCEVLKQNPIMVSIKE